MTLVIEIAIAFEEPGVGERHSQPGEYALKQKKGAPAILESETSCCSRPSTGAGRL